MRQLRGLSLHVCVGIGWGTKGWAQNPVSLQGQSEMVALEGAKASLDAYSFVGLTEQWECSLTMLYATLGSDHGHVLEADNMATNCHPACHNRTNPPGTLMPLPLRGRLESINRLDIELYSYA